MYNKTGCIHINSEDKADSETELIRRISCGDEEAFQELFYKYYYPLCGFAQKFTKSEELARDCVQDVFLKIWNIRRRLQVDYSPAAYLYRAVRNRALNLMDQEETQNRLLREQENEKVFESDHNFENDGIVAGEIMHFSDRMQQVWETVEKLPKQQRLVLELHRKNGLSYKEIANVLNIARKTVENHMGRALIFLRENLDTREFIEQ